MSLPEKLASLRKQKGLTQQNLAETLNVSRQAVSRWEVGAAVPTTDNLRVLSELYSVSVDYLLSDNATESLKSAKVQIILCSLLLCKMVLVFWTATVTIPPKMAVSFTKFAVQLCPMN